MSTTGEMHDAGGRSRPPWPTDSKVEPEFSSCHRYRYALSEIWNPDRPFVLWIMMNPSVATLDYSDPTLRKTGKYSRTWGYGGQLVGNVHAYRATDKHDLLAIEDPVGPDNKSCILRMAQIAKTIILAYGQPPQRLQFRGPELVKLLRAHPELCFLKMAKDGQTPMHPLYLPADLVPIPYPGTANT